MQCIPSRYCRSTDYERKGILDSCFPRLCRNSILRVFELYGLSQTGVEASSYIQYKTFYKLENIHFLNYDTACSQE